MTILNEHEPMNLLSHKKRRVPAANESTRSERGTECVQGARHTNSTWIQLSFQNKSYLSHFKTQLQKPVLAAGDAGSHLETEHTSTVS